MDFSALLKGMFQKGPQQMTQPGGVAGAQPWDAATSYTPQGSPVTYGVDGGFQGFTPETHQAVGQALGDAGKGIEAMEKRAAFASKQAPKAPDRPTMAGAFAAPHIYSATPKPGQFKKWIKE
jgi:hypothetical protein